MGCCGSSAKGDVAPRDDDPERETSAFTPQKLKLLRETLSPPRREKRGSACGRACKALFLITLVAAAAFSGAAAAGSSTRSAWVLRRCPSGAAAGRPWSRVAPRPRSVSARARLSAQRSIWAAPPWVSVARAWATCRRSRPSSRGGCPPRPGAVGLGRRRRGARAAGQGLDAAVAEAGIEAACRNAGEAYRKTSRKEATEKASADLRVVRRVPSQRSEV